IVRCVVPLVFGGSNWYETPPHRAAEYPVDVGLDDVANDVPRREHLHNLAPESLILRMILTNHRPGPSPTALPMVAFVHPPRPLVFRRNVAGNDLSNVL